MLITTPRFCAIIFGPSAWAMRNGAVMLTLNVSSHTSGFMSSMLARGNMLALLITQ
jgi:hypothetical protein